MFITQQSVGIRQLYRRGFSQVKRLFIGLPAFWTTFLMCVFNNPLRYSVIFFRGDPCFIQFSGQDVVSWRSIIAFLAKRCTYRSLLGRICMEAKIESICTRSNLFPDRMRSTPRMLSVTRGGIADDIICMCVLSLYFPVCEQAAGYRSAQSARATRVRHS